MRFGTYNHLRTIKQTGEITVKEMVVLKEGRKIIAFTDFNKYISTSEKKKSHKINERLTFRTHIIVKLLNYVYFDKYSIEKFEDIELDMVKNFIKEYGLCNLPGDNDLTHRGKETVNLCIEYVISFFIRVLSDKNLNMKFKEDDLYKTVKVFSKRSKKYIDTKVPVFDVYYTDSHKQKIFRDIPTDAFAIIMNRIYSHHPRILMLAASSAFAGCRPGESCNIRREDSLLGPGIMIDYVVSDGELKVDSVKLDLRYEFPLRDDNVSVGAIKKHRIQTVYHGLLDCWLLCYERYKEFNKYRKYDENYGPLTVNDQGKAMTYQTYFDEFRQVIKECIPILCADTNPNVVRYGMYLSTNHISPHILRHWFSVHLVLDGAELNDLMFWRGDSSIESSQPYIENKSDILNEHNLVAEKAFNFLLWRSENEFK